MEDNKLIAEFMGFSIDGDFAYIPDEGSPMEENMLISDMKYKSSWDWLMPVLKKIHEQMHPDSRGLWRMITHPFNYDIEDVHNQVVEFIKQLNKK